MSSENPQEPTHYEVLEITPDFPTQAIRSLRTALSKIYHPDGGTEPDGERLAKINDACDVLEHDDTRKRYDEKLAEKRGPEEAKAAAGERTKQAEEARKAREKSAGEAKSAGDAFRNQASAGTSRGGGAGSGASTGAGSSATGGRSTSGTKPGYVPPRPPVTPPSGGSGSRPVTVEESALVIVSCVAAVAIIGLVVGAIVGAAHPGNHLPNNPLFAPVAILCLIVCPAGTLLIR